MDFEFRDADTGESLGSGEFASPDEARQHVRGSFGKRRVAMRPVPPTSSIPEKFKFGAVEGLTGPLQLLTLAGYGLKGGLTGPMRRAESLQPSGSGGVSEGLAEGADVIGGARESVAKMIGLAGAPDQNEADLAVSAGRAAGSLVYGPRNLANVAGAFGGEAADYIATKAGASPLTRMMASVVGDVGATQIASAANRRAVSGLAGAAMHTKALRAYKRLKVLDIVSDDAASALDIASQRATRMMGAEKIAWGRYDTALRKGLNRTGTAFDSVAEIDPTDLFREANYIWTKTPEEARASLPDVVKSLVSRSKKGSSAGKMSVTDLRGFHEQINELWRAASHPNADPFALGHATVADQLREPILRSYESILGPPQPVVSDLQGLVPKGPTLTSGKPPLNASQIGTTPRFRPPSRINLPGVTDEATEQANALRVALESSRQTGGELNRLKSVGAGVGSGVLLEPRKVIEAVVGGKGQIESPEIAQDLFNMVVREDPKNGPRIMAQTYQDYVIGEGDFTTKSALQRIAQSRAVGRVWAGEDRVRHLENVIRWAGDKKSPAHRFARGALSYSLGTTAALAVSGARIPNTIEGVLGTGAAFIAGESIPRVFVYLKDTFGEEGVRQFSREMLLDRGKFIKAQGIANRIPTAKDFEWVNLQMRALALRQTNNVAAAAGAE